MLKLNTLFTGIALLVLHASLNAQAPTFDEMNFEADSTSGVYKPSGKNFVLVKSKKGTGGLNKTPQADAILSAEVTEIVLVFSETEGGAIAEREQSNRERWENLLATYPEFFQFSTTYKNVCQCKIGGDAEAFKKVQGFYVFVNGDVPKMEEPKTPEVPPTPAATKPTKMEEPAAVVKVEEKKQEEKKQVEKKVAETVPVKTEQPVAEKEKEPVKPSEEKPTAAVEHHEEHHDDANSHSAHKSGSDKKRTGAPKARKAKNSKACRPACYEGGDEDLYTFFRTNMPLTRKERRKSKNLAANVKLQLDVDGSIKKSAVTGDNEKFNKHVEEVIKSMSPWNCSVKNGVAVRSEVKFTVKYDKESKSMKPFDILINPKPGPKCKCATDSEIFGND